MNNFSDFLDSIFNNTIDTSNDVNSENSSKLANPGNWFAYIDHLAKTNITGMYNTISDWIITKYGQVSSYVTTTINKIKDNNIYKANVETIQQIAQDEVAEYSSLATKVADTHTTYINRVTNIINGNDGTGLVDIGEGIVENTLVSLGDQATNGITALSNWISNALNGNDGNLATTIKGVASMIAKSMVNYQDGVEETDFGTNMESSWSKSSTSFLVTFAGNSKSYKINVMATTPLDAGDTSESLYGNLILGTPFLYTQMTDPNNRTMINTFVKDSKIITLTPGLPKYNGSDLVADAANSILRQTQTGEEQLEWLLKNGLDGWFAERDKRYYVFQPKFEQYYSYLEALLTPLWLKMGLGSGDDGQTFDIFSFFDISGGKDKTKDSDQLKTQYRSPIGFFVNPSGALSESIDNSPNNIGSEMAAKTNEKSDTYQKLNFITGMGTSTMGNVGRKMAMANNMVGDIANLYTEAKGSGSGIGNMLSAAGEALGNVPAVGRLLQVGMNVAASAVNVTNYFANNDAGSIIQSFAAYNGMRVMYPNLWGESSYAKNMNISFNFVSPYGDPMSIFRYVYVPFMSLLCFALPRQAAANGFVSPFLVRADIPGLFTSDMALISNVTWTKGGEGNLFTKDGLPRAISGSFTISDLYPYLAMTKRYSFLSANPSLSVWLDNMSGMRALNLDSSDDSLNQYWKRMLDRVAGDSQLGDNTAYNTPQKAEMAANKAFRKLARRDSASRALDSRSVPWMTKQ